MVWKQAFSVAAFELKASIPHLLSAYLLFPFLVFAIIHNFQSYLDLNFVGMDLLFMLIFTIGPLWAKPKAFQIQIMNGSFFVTAPVIMLQSLPIKKEVIIKSRFIIYFIYALPIQLIFLILFYNGFPLIQNMMGISAYISFSLIWLSISVYLGGSFPAAEIGDNSSIFKQIVYTILFVILGIIGFTALHLLSGQGLVYWTLHFAQGMPLIASVVSIILAVIGFKYLQYYMGKRLDTLDYL